MNEHHLNARYGTIDHIVPVSAGGEHTMANCVVMHRSCNAKKGTKVVEQVQLRIV
jgi:5-methylcytosine-specific restriction endonuclease McrA